MAPYSNDDETEQTDTVKWFEKSDQILLDCPIEGIPKPSKKWFFNSSKLDLEQSLEYSTMMQVENSRLKINELDESLQGLYICNASNEFGWKVYNHLIQIAGKLI